MEKESMEELWLHGRHVSCAGRAFEALGEGLGIPWQKQAVQGASALQGLSSCGGCCGFLSAALLAMGIAGARRGLDPGTIAELGCLYTDRFKKRFGGIRCEDLEHLKSGDVLKRGPCREWQETYLAFTLAFVEQFMEGAS